MQRADSLLQRCVDHLRELPFVDEATLVRDVADRGQRSDGLLRVVTPGARQEFVVEAKRSHLTRAIVDGVLASAARHKKPWILFAPHVGRPLAKVLDERGANFVDLAGNCRLQVGRRHLAKIEGRPPERRPAQGRGMGAPGQNVLFALLVRPELANAPVRELGKAAGVAPATAADRLAQLREEGSIHESPHGWRLTDPRRLLDRWLKGYETLVRPKLLIGRFRTRETDPKALERRIETALKNGKAWAFGGGAAAERLTRFYRGPETVLHVREPDPDLTKRLHALRAEDGALILLRAPCPVAFEGVLPRTVAPLLVYAELLFAGDKRANEAADSIRQKYLGESS